MIDGALNISDDGLEKPARADTPLKILTHGDRENVLDIYAGETHTWRLNQKPTTAKNPGLNLETGGSSKLFVESSTGNLGLGITKPIAKLHIQQTGSQNALRIDDEAGDTTPLIVDAEGKVGIGTDNPSHFFHVKTGDSVGLFESTGTQAYLRLSTKEGIENRIEIANRPGGRLALWTAGVGDVLNITKEGNVGIGKTDPTKKLDVNGDAAIAGTLSVTKTLSVTDKSTLTGNVGIGTAPTNTEKLKVNGNTAISGNLAITKNLSVTGTGGRNYFKDTEKSDGNGLRVGAAWGMYGI